MSSANKSTDSYRSSGSSRIAFRTIWRRSCGTCGLRSGNVYGGEVLRTAADASRTVLRGDFPVSSLYSTAPSEYTSVAVVWTSPLTCSGLA